MVHAKPIRRRILASDKQLARLPLHRTPDKVLTMTGHTLQGADGVAKVLEEIAKRMGGGTCTGGAALAAVPSARLGPASLGAWMARPGSCAIAVAGALAALAEACAALAGTAAAALA